MITPTTEQLLGLIATGNLQAFAHLHGRCVARVKSIASALLRNVAIAEEVTQEVFLQIWQKADHFDAHRGRADSWIDGIARSRAIDRIRKVQTGSNRDDAYAISEAAASDHMPSAEDVALNRFDRAQIHTALLAINPLQRQAIVLAFFGGRTHVQVAGEVGCPLGTAKTRIRDGLQALAKIIRSQITDGDTSFAPPTTGQAKPPEITRRAA